MTSMTPVQERAWEAMLDAQLSELYWKKKSFWINFRLNTIKVVSGLIGCTAFGSLFFEPQMAIWNKIATLVAAVLAFYMSNVDPKQTLDRSLQAQEAYGSLFTQYEKLWNKVLLAL
jgi:hypothetical protein